MNTEYASAMPDDAANKQTARKSLKRVCKPHGNGTVDTGNVSKANRLVGDGQVWCLSTHGQDTDDCHCQNGGNNDCSYPKMEVPRAGRFRHLSGPRGVNEIVEVSPK